MRLKQYLLLQMHMEGELESAKVGAMDGEQVGAVSRGQGSRKQARAVGRLGVTVGRLKGALEGAKVGALDENQVGAAEGTALGTQLGK